MTSEELEKAIEFIVDQEAKSSAKIDALVEAYKEAHKEADERWRRADESWRRADERWARTEEGIRALLAIAELHEREILSLGEQTRSTDDRLNVLINVVERHISEGRNGNSE